MKNLQQTMQGVSDKCKRSLPIYLGLAGILFIFASSFVSSDKAEPVQAQPQAAQVQQLQSQLKELIGSIEGVGQVEVMLTLDTESEQVYATDQTTENTQSDQSKTARQQSSHVILGSGSQQQPLVETTYMPQVRGVAVVCEGAEDITVVSRITNAVSVVLDLPASRICVTKMK